MNWLRRLAVFTPFKQRIICINGPIYHETASAVVAQLLFLGSEQPLKPIHLYINSLGGAHLYINSLGCALGGAVNADPMERVYSQIEGDVTAGLAIYDAMHFIRSPVSTYCLGEASSMGSLLLAAGTPGKRCALPHSRVMICRRPLDFKITTEEIHLKGIYARHTGQPIQRIEQYMDGRTFMSPDEAKEFGLIDKVIAHHWPSGP